MVCYFSIRATNTKSKYHSLELGAIRTKVESKILGKQNYNKGYYDKRHHKVKFNVGDYFMVQNFDSIPGTGKKLIPKFRIHMRSWGNYGMTDM